MGSSCIYAMYLTIHQYINQNNGSVFMMMRVIFFIYGGQVGTYASTRTHKRVKRMLLTWTNLTFNLWVFILNCVVCWLYGVSHKDSEDARNSTQVPVGTSTLGYWKLVFNQQSPRISIASYTTELLPEQEMPQRMHAVSMGRICEKDKLWVL